MLFIKNLINEVNNVLLLNTKHVEKGRDVTRLQTSSQSLSSAFIIIIIIFYYNSFFSFRNVVFPPLAPPDDR